MADNNTLGGIINYPYSQKTADPYEEAIKSRKSKVSPPAEDIPQSTPSPLPSENPRQEMKEALLTGNKDKIKAVKDKYPGSFSVGE